MAAKNAVSQGTVKDAVARFRVKRREMFKELLHKKRERERGWPAALVVTFDPMRKQLDTLGNIPAGMFLK